MFAAGDPNRLIPIYNIKKFFQKGLTNLLKYAILYIEKER